MTNRLGKLQSTASNEPSDMGALLRRKLEVLLHDSRMLLDNPRPYIKDDPRFDQGAMLAYEIFHISEIVEKCHVMSRAKGLPSGYPEDEPDYFEYTQDHMKSWSNAELQQVVSEFDWDSKFSINDINRKIGNVMRTIKAREIETTQENYDPEKAKQEAFFQEFMKGAVASRDKTKDQKNLGDTAYDVDRVRLFAADDKNALRMTLESFEASFPNEPDAPQAGRS